MVPAIEVRGLRKRFGALEAVRGVDLVVETGSCVALLGPNGAGKTTTLEILEGLQPATSGEITLLGRRWDRDAGELRERIGIQFQETHLFPQSTVTEAVRLFRSFHPAGMSAEEAIALVGLQEKARTQIGQLSGGQRQRVALATALVGEPELLFLDEPTTGLDPQSRYLLWDVVANYKASGRTVILTTHYMEEAQRLADKVVVMDHGQVIAEGSSAELIARHGGPNRIELVSVPPAEAALFDDLPGARVEHLHPDGRVTVGAENLHRVLPQLFQRLGGSGRTLQDLSTRSPTLDDVFATLTGRSLRDP